ncbi:OpgC domain-containing protein [Paraburkholderia acidipaludis]|uniref:OpgC domain-containing protein n=1 Tax=Paraburkholderia acidipaludis TaxID=660537 RepID=UPI00047FB801|nr:OpgC domain-containing protein [Paraburkholderia acidipaludis]
MRAVLRCAACAPNRRASAGDSRGPQAVRLGWVRRLAESLPAVANVGQQGLVCFVGGAVASNVVDTLLRATHLDTYFPARLAGDLLAIGALVTLAGGARWLKTARPRLALT